MRPVMASEIKSNEDYVLERDTVRKRTLALKAPRRVAVGDHITVLFENRDTVRYQVQEMMRVEAISDPRAIAHELKTYNELVPGDEELRATLLIEYSDEKTRDVWLRRLLGLEDHVYLEVDGAGRTQAEFDMRQVSAERISAVHYIRFALGAAAAEALRKGAGAKLGVDHPEMKVCADLSAAQRSALGEDLRAP